MRKMGSKKLIWGKRKKNGVYYVEGRRHPPQQKGKWKTGGTVRFSKPGRENDEQCVNALGMKNRGGYKGTTIKSGRGRGD